MNANTLTALIACKMIKTFVAGEIVALCASNNVLPSMGRNPYVVRVYGDSKEELIENRKRCRDAVRVFGLTLKNRAQFKDGTTIAAIPFENDPFNQIKHYFAEVIVTYSE